MLASLFLGRRGNNSVVPSARVPADEIGFNSAGGAPWAEIDSQRHPAQILGTLYMGPEPGKACERFVNRSRPILASVYH